MDGWGIGDHYLKTMVMIQVSHIPWTKLCSISTHAGDHCRWFFYFSLVWGNYIKFTSIKWMMFSTIYTSKLR